MSSETAETAIAGANDDSSRSTSYSQSNSYSGSGGENEDMDSEAAYFPLVGFDTDNRNIHASY